MQVVADGGNEDFAVDQPPQTVRDRGDAAGELVRVADDRDVGSKRVLVCADEGVEVVAADLLLTFDQHDQIHRQPARLLAGADGLDVAPHLPLVVDGASGVYRLVTRAVVAHRRLERRSRPLVQRLGRLHVVVAVKQHCWPAGLVLVAGEHERVAFSAARRRDAGVKPDFAEAWC